MAARLPLAVLLVALPLTAHANIQDKETKSAVDACLADPSCKALPSGDPVPSSWAGLHHGWKPGDEYTNGCGYPDVKAGQPPSLQIEVDDNVYTEQRETRFGPWVYLRTVTDVVEGMCRQATTETVPKALRSEVKKIHIYSLNLDHNSPEFHSMCGNAATGQKIKLVGTTLEIAMACPNNQVQDALKKFLLENLK